MKKTCRDLVWLNSKTENIFSVGQLPCQYFNVDVKLKYWYFVIVKILECNLQDWWIYTIWLFLLFFMNVLVKLGASKSFNCISIIISSSTTMKLLVSLIWNNNNSKITEENKQPKKTVLNQFIMLRNLIGLQLWLAVPWILTHRLDLDSFILQFWVLDIYMLMGFSAVWTKSNILIGFPKRINIILQSKYKCKQFSWCKI